MNLLEIIGYLATVLIAISLMMKSMVKLRWINLFGASTFATYGYLIDAYPVMVLNGSITIIDIIYLFQMYYKKDYFEIFQVKSFQASAFFQRFLEYHDEDIRHFFPGVDYNKLKDPLVFVVSRNMMPVGIFIGEPRGKGVLEIIVEYVIPDYRDLKNAFYIYENKEEHFLKHGFRELLVKTNVPEHIRFVKKIGFKPDKQKGSDWYKMELD